MLSVAPEEICTSNVLLQYAAIIYLTQGLLLFFSLPVSRMFSILQIHGLF